MTGHEWAQAAFVLPRLSAQVHSPTQEMSVSPDQLLPEPRRNPYTPSETRRKAMP